jgi:mannose-6-phosphate isomerase-like protein (cupin superfamily)
VCAGDEDNHLVLRAGESVFVPLNTDHRFRNSGTEPVVFEVEISLARNFEKALRAQFGLVGDGNDQRQGDSEERL